MRQESLWPLFSRIHIPAFPAIQPKTCQSLLALTRSSPNSVCVVSLNSPTIWFLLASWPVCIPRTPQAVSSSVLVSLLFPLPIWPSPLLQLVKCGFPLKIWLYWRNLFSLGRVNQLFLFLNLFIIASTHSLTQPTFICISYYVPGTIPGSGETQGTIQTRLLFLHWYNSGEVKQTIAYKPMNKAITLNSYKCFHYNKKG